ncbi:hypothetical protein N7532_007034 [Penicillium argentinense]|uniref:Protein BNI4 n=1 Tax=Penicillium argentinense TaxID=1131581 RepID=A0A9W9KBJ2_9EURO|nr:uncharacterized protein N7532_007034 [Penicillium argentinense]KAJ5100033.1 hypothetical protein N7532_007034 [Penicillium argentinense]
MAALVQTIPQQSGTVPVLQTRPSSSSGTFAGPSSQSHGSRYQNMSWSSFNASNTGGYRAGNPVAAPYAYAPNLSHSPTANNNQHRQSWSPHLRPEHRTFSAPVIPQVPGNPSYAGATPRVVNPAAGSVSTSSNSSFHTHVSKDDSAIPSRQPRADQPLRPLSTANLPPPSVMTISSPAGSAKPSPNRYRRPNQTARSQSPAPASSSASTSADNQANGASTGLRAPRFNGHNRGSSADESSNAHKQPPELAKRYRRRSLGNMDPSTYPELNLQLPVSSSPPPQSDPYDFISFDSNPRPRSAHSHRNSSGSVHSAHSSTSSVRDGPAFDSSPVNSKSGKSEEKRVAKPSPLSQPASTSPDSPTVEKTENDEKEPTASSPPADSPAAKRLTELKNESSKRPGKSRLRRAFSFGSASELLKNSNATKREVIAAEKARQEALREELGEEQAAIAAQQEAMGLGESIYSHQGGLFSRSTDALSVSSTASSASMMLRKMGKGVKKSGRSLVGLFRPKSVADVEGAINPITPEISVVNVEAERESVTVNPDPADLPRGGTVFPKVEGSSSEIRRSASIRERDQRVVSDPTTSRKSIVGGDSERAAILSTMKRGILKKTHSDLGVSSPAHALNGNDSPHSSAPTTPDARQADHVKIAGEDYFLTEPGRYNATDAKSAPITPQSVAGRNIAFSPRIQFHDTWPSGEYDRRGDIATCNRLTPLLAQQIREEINNFKMEMEVHENSKIYTHFI